jgi:hypothetical protein
MMDLQMLQTYTTVTDIFMTPCEIFATVVTALVNLFNLLHNTFLCTHYLQQGGISS